MQEHLPVLLNQAGIGPDCPRQNGATTISREPVECDWGYERVARQGP